MRKPIKEKIHHISLGLCIINLIFFAISSIISLTAKVNFVFVIVDEQGIVPISFPTIFLALTVIFLALAIFSQEKEVDPNESWVNLRKIFNGKRIPYKQ